MKNWQAMQAERGATELKEVDGRIITVLSNVPLNEGESFYTQAVHSRSSNIWNEWVYRCDAGNGNVFVCRHKSLADARAKRDKWLAAAAKEASFKGPNRAKYSDADLAVLSIPLAMIPVKALRAAYRFGNPAAFLRENIHPAAGRSGISDKQRWAALRREYGKDIHKDAVDLMECNSNMSARHGMTAYEALSYEGQRAIDACASEGTLTEHVLCEIIKLDRIGYKPVEEEMVEA